MMCYANGGVALFERRLDSNSIRGQMHVARLRLTSCGPCRAAAHFL